ncbi:shikimate kinase [Flammeovirgaceae bacterium SG7u.111]|nr:shikimate kinase [Flammeovirgaceae bacterium SG7u.132]WPO36040.1 shikimate kinase [Flammeovirgaceae bacterium SG7u.111]
MRIYLIGMPASGKSTVGSELAERLGYDFVDTDDLIAEREGIGIPEIFSEKGEDYFRKVEGDVLRSTLPEKAVIATGGGVPCFAGNMEFIKEQGISVYLKVPVEELASRSMAQHGARPLLKDFVGLQLLDELKSKLKAREVFYNQADLQIQGKQPDIDTLIEKLKLKATL